MSEKKPDNREIRSIINTSKQINWLVVIAGLLVTTPLILAPTPINLFVPEHPGSSEKQGREDSNDIFAMEHKIFQPFDPATGRPSSAIMHNPMTVVKVIDKSTPGLHKALVTGQNLSEVNLRWYRIDPTNQVETEYFTITLSNARIVNMETFMPMSFLPKNESFRHMEKVSFVYERIERNWIPIPTMFECDFDGNEFIDERDFAIFLAAFGLSSGEPGYNPAYDYDGDGMITIVDYELWLLCYRDFTGDPFAPPPVGTLGDFNIDGDRDLADFAYMQRCMPTPEEISFPCILMFDYNGDQTVDLPDFFEFIVDFSGP